MTATHEQRLRLTLDELLLELRRHLGHGARVRHVLDGDHPTSTLLLTIGTTNAQLWTVDMADQQQPPSLLATVRTTA